jgi:hypothetical protein
MQIAARHVQAEKARPPRYERREPDSSVMVKTERQAWKQNSQSVPIEERKQIPRRPGIRTDRKKDRDSADVAGPAKKPRRRVGMVVKHVIDFD